jgi:hypothetical protein
MDSEKILLNKNGFCFSCVKKNSYKLNFYIENQNIILPKIINFDLIKLIYDLNPDIYEKVTLEKINDNEAIATLLMKHFFEDVGMPQRFTFIHVQKIIDDNTITFQSKSIKTHKPDWLPDNAELTPMQNLTIVCNIITPHHVQFSCNVAFDNAFVVPPFAEKFLSIVLHNIFKRVKEFIDNIVV